MNNLPTSNPSEPKNEIVVYQPDETIRLDVLLENETEWLNRHQMSTLFGRDIKTIGKHIANVLSEELSCDPLATHSSMFDAPQNSVVAKFATTAAEFQKLRWLGFPLPLHCFALFNHDKVTPFIVFIAAFGRFMRRSRIPKRLTLHIYSR